MPKSYRRITAAIARQIRLVVTDIDGTITIDYDTLCPDALDAIRRLEKAGIPVGFCSGRFLSRIEASARELGVTGPIIAENGAVAKLSVSSELIDLGYSRRCALEGLETLRKRYGDAIDVMEENQHRLVETTLRTAIHIAELRQCLPPDTDINDSGYMMHIAPKGVSKGKTLLALLGRIDGGLQPEQLMVFGDSLTDLSLFELFPNSVLITNPRIPAEERRRLEKVAKYTCEIPVGNGFALVIEHFLFNHGT